MLHSTLYFFIIWYSPFIYVSFSKDNCVIGLGPILIQYDLLVAYFQQRSHSQVPGARTSTYPFGAHKQSSLKLFHFDLSSLVDINLMLLTVKKNRLLYYPSFLEKKADKWST